MAAGPVRGGFRPPIVSTSAGEEGRGGGEGRLPPGLSRHITPYARPIPARSAADEAGGIVSRLAGAVKRWLFSLGSLPRDRDDSARAFSRKLSIQSEPAQSGSVQRLSAEAAPSVHGVQQAGSAGLQTSSEILSDLILLPHFRSSRCAAFQQLGRFFAAKGLDRLTRYEFDQVAAVLRRLTVPSETEPPGHGCRPAHWEGPRALFHFDQGDRPVAGGQPQRPTPDEMAMDFCPEPVSPGKGSGAREPARTKAQEPARIKAQEPARVFSARFAEDEEPADVEEIEREYSRPQSVLVPVPVQPQLNIRDIPQILGARLAPRTFPVLPAGEQKPPQLSEERAGSVGLARGEEEGGGEKGPALPIQPLFTFSPPPPADPTRPPAELIAPVQKPAFDFGLGPGIGPDAAPKPESGRETERRIPEAAARTAEVQSAPAPAPATKSVAPPAFAFTFAPPQPKPEGDPPKPTLTLTAPVFSFSAPAKPTGSASLGDVGSSPLFGTGAGTGTGTGFGFGLGLGISTSTSTSTGIGFGLGISTNTDTGTGTSTNTGQDATPKVATDRPLFGDRAEIRPTFSLSAPPISTDQKSVLGDTAGAGPVAPKPQGFSFGQGISGGGFGDGLALSSKPQPTFAFGRVSEADAKADLSGRQGEAPSHDGNGSSDSANGGPVTAPGLVSESAPRPFSFSMPAPAPTDFSLGSQPLAFNFGAAAQPAFVFGAADASLQAPSQASGLTFSMGSAGSPAGSARRRRHR